MKGGGELLEPVHWGRETVSLQKVNSWCHGTKAYFKTLVIGSIKILSILSIRSLNGSCKSHIVSYNAFLQRTC